MEPTYVRHVITAAQLPPEEGGGWVMWCLCGWTVEGPTHASLGKFESQHMSRAYAPAKSQRRWWQIDDKEADFATHVGD